MMRRFSLAVLISLGGISCGGGQDGPATSEREEEKEEETSQGNLEILLHGLPEGLKAAVRVVASDGEAIVVDGSEVLDDLAVGTYRVEASVLFHETMRYTPTPVSAEVEVEEGVKATVEIGYTASIDELFLLHAKDVQIPHFRTAELVVDVERPRSWKGAISLRLEDLPEGFSAEAIEMDEEATVATIGVRSDGEAKSILPFTALLVGEGGGWTTKTTVRIEPRLVVFEKEDGIPGSLRSLVEALSHIENPLPPPVIVFDPEVFDEPTTLSLTSTLTIADALILRGPKSEGEPRIHLEGDDSFTLLRVEEGAEVEIHDLGLRLGNASLGGLIRNLGTLTLRRTHLTEGTADFFGGCIFTIGTLTVEDSRIEACSAQSGAGIYVDAGSAASTRIERSQILDNEAAEMGGGIFLGKGATIVQSHIAGNRGEGKGGGVYVGASSSITESLIEENFAGSEGGGGVYNDADLTIERSTLRGNTTTGDGGGALLGGRDVIRNSTFAENHADGRGGGLMYAGGTVYSYHATIADNTAGIGGGMVVDGGNHPLFAAIVWRNWEEGSESDIVVEAGNVSSSGYNMLGGIAGPLELHENDLHYVDPNIESIADNGGLTPTMAFRPWSAAIDAIPLEDCYSGDALTTDQRGLPRPAGHGCDPGAFEAQ